MSKLGARPLQDPAALASAAGAVEADAARTTRGNDGDRLNAGTLLKLAEDERMLRLLKNKPLRDLLVRALPSLLPPPPSLAQTQAHHRHHHRHRHQRRPPPPPPRR